MYIFLKIYNFFSRVQEFIFDSISDSWRYAKHSTLNPFNKSETLGAELLAHIHSIERAFSLRNTRKPFGVALTKSLQQLTAATNQSDKFNFERNLANNSLDDYAFFHGYRVSSESNLRSVKNYLHLKKQRNTPFLDVLLSRRSIRNFGTENVSVYSVLKALVIAKNSSPSVCNRQPWKIYLVANQDQIKKCLLLQNGNSGIEGVQKLLIITTTLNSFFGSNERNQAYIDGGIILSAVLNALHYKNIASCALNWAVPRSIDFKLRGLLNLDDSCEVISMVALGSYANNSIKVASSFRKPLTKILTIRK